MKYLTAVVASAALAALAGCAASTPLTISDVVGPAPAASGSTPGATSLQVYTARVRAPIDVNKEEFLWNNDFGRNDFLYEPAHSDYDVCSRDGRVLEHVHNARTLTDPEAAVVALPPGSYLVKAKARGFGLVTVPVVIEAGKLTRVNLQQGINPIAVAVTRTNAVLLGGYRVVGWRAPRSAWPTSQ